MNKKLVALAVLVLVAAVGAPAQKKKKPSKGAQYEYEKAVVAMNYGLQDEAVRYLSQAIALDPKHAESFKLMGVLQFRKKNYPEGAAAYEKYLALNPADSETQANLGYCYEYLDRPDRAEAEYMKAIAIDGNANACFGLSKLFLKQQKFAEARTYAEQTITKKADWPAALNLLGVIQNQTKQYPEAAATFGKALLLAPDDINLSVNLGVALINTQEYAKAKKVLEQALPRIEDQELRTQVEGYLKLASERLESPGS